MKIREDYRCHATESALAVVTLLVIFALFALTTFAVVGAY